MHDRHVADHMHDRHAADLRTHVGPHYTHHEHCDPRIHFGYHMDWDCSQKRDRRDSETSIHQDKSEWVALAGGRIGMEAEEQPQDAPIV